MSTATTYSAIDVAVTSSVTPVRLDASPLAGRIWVRVVNPDPLLRVFIGHATTTGANLMGTNCEAIDPTGGVYEMNLGTGIPMYAILESATTITVRVNQYA